MVGWWEWTDSLFEWRKKFIAFMFTNWRWNTIIDRKTIKFEYNIFIDGIKKLFHLILIDCFVQSFSELASWLNIIVKEKERLNDGLFEAPKIKSFNFSDWNINKQFKRIFDQIAFFLVQNVLNTINLLLLANFDTFLSFQFKYHTIYNIQPITPLYDRLTVVP